MQMTVAAEMFICLQSAVLNELNGQGRMKTVELIYRVSSEGL